MAGEDVFGKADALMKRHRAFVAAGAQSAPPPPPEDVPVLTEVVDPQAAPRLPQALSGGPDTEALAESMREALAPLPPDIARAVESWLAATLPHLVARQLEGVSEHVAHEVGAALRDSLPLLISDLVRNAAERAKDGE
ncbi:MAG: hypothetical protein C0522_12840 [Rhodocyclaceae bacterium]|jgi:hypothetical protein|nr:hypothetical protein [Rhodocyclaceae bacterium]